MPSTSVSRIIAAPADEIWETLADIENATRWNASWKEIEITSSQTHGEGTRFRAKVDDELAFEFEVADWVAPEFISFTPVHDPMEPAYSITLDGHAFRLTKIDERATAVELIASATVHGFRGIIMGLFMWSNHQKPGLVHALDRLQAVFEPDKEFVEDETIGVLEEDDSK